MDPEHRHGLTRRHALALGAAAGAASLAGAHAAPASAGVRTRELRVGREAFGRGGRTGPLAAPPFLLLGVRHPLGLGARLEVRTRRRGGRWSGWHRLQAGLGHGPDHAGIPAAGEPLFTGRADELELRASRRPARDVRLALVHVPASARALLAARAADAHARAAQVAGVPPIVPRAAWAGAAAPPRSLPSYGRVLFGTVHHTESTNAYGPEDAAAGVLAVAQFHIFTRGWNDIGYNFVVDRYGTIYEGRAGGIGLPVIGAHAQGFNSISTGVSILGGFMDVDAPGAATAAVARLLGWKLPAHGVPVSGQVTVVSGGGSLSRWPYGARVTLPRICGHRDVGSTDCPGNHLYRQLPGIRSSAAANALPVVIRPEVTLAASRPRVAYGGRVRFEGKVLGADKVPQRGVPVRLQKRAPGGAWTTVAQATSGAGGDFAVTVPWRRGGLAQAAAAGVTSLPVAVGVAPALTVTADAAQVAAGQSVRLSGTMRPPGTLTVVVQRRVRGRWRAERRLSAKVRSGFALDVPLPRAGLRRLVVTAASSGERTTARPILVRVAPRGTAAPTTPAPG